MLFKFHANIFFWHYRFDITIFLAVLSCWVSFWLFFCYHLWKILGYDILVLLQVVEVSTSKTGKHGHAKCHFVGIDIFTGKKLEDIVPSSHNCDVCLSLMAVVSLLFLITIFPRSLHLFSFLLLYRFLMSLELTTSWLTSLKMDLYVQFERLFLSCFTRLEIIAIWLAEMF